MGFKFVYEDKYKPRKEPTIVSLAHALRKKSKIKVRQPLPSVSIIVTTLLNAESLVSLEELIKTEINVKAVHYLNSTNNLIGKKSKANFPILGKQYGNKIKPLSEAILALTQAKICTLEAGKIDFKGAKCGHNLL